MKALLEGYQGGDIAIESSTGDLSYDLLFEKVEKLSLWLQEQGATSVCVYAQNSVDWIIIDLACQQSDIIFTPIPLFFSAMQFDSLLSSVQPNLIFSDSDLAFKRGSSSHHLSLQSYLPLQEVQVEFPLATSKVTYTSGSTGSPKGVCLSKENQLKVAKSLVQCIGLSKPRHLCLLPFPTLLENIAGIYSPLIAGGTVIVLNDNERGFSGSRLINPQQLFSSISQHQPDSLILVPELLQALIFGVNNGWKPPLSLKFIAVGGSKISSSLIAKARECQLPVYQGYGLSESGSVVSLCTPHNDLENSAGTLLPHLTASIKDNELIVKGNTFLGYLEDKRSWYQTEVCTGDIATIEDRAIYINGRQKNILINSFGRNISPEWLESEMLSTGGFSQVVVLGDSKPFCLAIVTPSTLNTTHSVIQKTIDQVNNSLPDYAQIKAFISLNEPMSFAQGLVTANGRPIRAAIMKKFNRQINTIYLNTTAA
ncbi:AMP-binding protein [Colwelliaceae bacterium 6441]